MTANGWLQIGLFCVAILVCTRPLGAFLHRVFEGERHLLSRPLGWLERLVYRLGGVGGEEQSWRAYTVALLAFSLFSLVVTYLIQRLQGVLPWNPQGLGAVGAGSAFNTAASFTTNTNWQGYVGEATMSYLSQMAGLAWHNFTSAAAGIGVAVALAGGPPRRGRRLALGHDRQLLGGPDARDRLRAAAALGRVRARVRLAGHDPEPRSVRGGQHGRGREAGDRHGAGRVAGGDQAARHERGRL